MAGFCAVRQGPGTGRGTSRAAGCLCVASRGEGHDGAGEGMEGHCCGGVEKGHPTPAPHRTRHRGTGGAASLPRASGALGGAEEEACAGPKDSPKVRERDPEGGTGVVGAARHSTEKARHGSLGYTKDAARSEGAADDGRPDGGALRGAAQLPGGLDYAAVRPLLDRAARPLQLWRVRVRWGCCVCVWKEE